MLTLGSEVKICWPHKNCLEEKGEEDKLKLGRIKGLKILAFKIIVLLKNEVS
jgi:hypothetical protein